MTERDVTLKFIENNKGYHNVEGRGSNVFGRFTITGTLDQNGIITLFRHYQVQKKLKASSKKRDASTLTSTKWSASLQRGAKYTKLNKSEQAESKRKEKEAKKKGKRMSSYEGGDHKRMELSEVMIETSISQAQSQAYGDSVSRTSTNLSSSQYPQHSQPASRPHIQQSSQVQQRSGATQQQRQSSSRSSGSGIEPTEEMKKNGEREGEVFDVHESIDEVSGLKLCLPDYTHRKVLCCWSA